jgi:MFS family permease
VFDVLIAAILSATGESISRVNIRGVQLENEGAMPEIQSTGLFGNEPVNVLEPDSARVIRIWWALAWRAIVGIVGGALLASGVAFIGTLFLGLVGAVLGLNGGAVTAISNAFGAVMTILFAVGATIVAVGLVLRKEFRGFRVVLLKVS